MRALRAGAAVAALALALPAAASAAGIELRSVDTTRLPEVRLVVSLDEVTPGQVPTFQVSENGALVPKVDVESAATSTSYALVVDTSQSMKGASLRSAIEGASAFLRTVKEGDRVAIYGFGSEVRTLAPFSGDTSSLYGVVGGLQIDAVQGTALHDAVVTASRGLSSEDSSRRRVMVVLTDGDDYSSAATAEMATTAATKAQAAVYAIGIESEDFNPSFMQALSSATGGTYAEGGVDELNTIFARVAEDLLRTFVLNYGSTSAGRVALEVDAGGTRVVRTNYVGGAPIRVTSGEGVIPASITQASWSLAALGGGTLLVVLLGTMAVLRPRPRRSLAQRLEPYTDSRSRAIKAAEAEGGNSASGMLRSLALTTEKILGKLEVWKGMAATIERADLPLRTAELFYIMVGAGLALGLIVRIAGAPVLAVLGSLAVGGVIPYLFVRLKARQRSKAFDAQLPDILIGMAGSLKAGHSFSQAMESTIKEGAEPAAKEFSRVANEIRLGRASEEALEAMAKRLGSKNFEFVVMAVNVQRQVGGSMAELLDGVGETVRLRQQFLRKVKALCAMGRMSAYTLVALPVIMGAAISVINPAYISPLFTTSTGRILIIIAICSTAFGGLILKKIVSFKV
jgi:tight adherence protein B